MGFILKKIAGALLMPLPALLLVGMVGWVLWVRGRWKRTGQGLVAASLLLMSLMALTPLSDALVRPLERSAPAFPGDSVDFVVVLASGHVSDSTLPLSARLSSAALVRLVEGVSIATAQPWSRLVLSGWGGADPKPNAEVYGEMAVALGFSEARMIRDPRPKDTRQEAELLAPLLRGHRFALVTSASHMPRALALFRAQGLEPVPAPTGHLSKTSPALDLLDFVPDEDALAQARFAWHETLGRIWARLTGGL